VQSRQNHTQFFGARTNLPKLLLYALNGGRDEITGDQVGPAFPPLASGDGPLRYEEVVQRLDAGMDWIAALYTNTINVIHFMHDKYNFERLQMALHDTFVRRLLAFGIRRHYSRHARVCTLSNPNSPLLQTV
jgi:formate C-acetyltransferase